MQESNINAHCAICGKGYHICNSCQDQKDFKPWRSVVDSIEHYKIYVTIASYTNGAIDKETAKRDLEQCNITDYKNFVPHIAEVIEQILKTEKKTTRKKTTKTTTQEVETVENTDEEIVNSLVED